MTNRIMPRTWISPAISVTFIIVSVSGLLLTFHVRVGNMKGLHEWIGYAFAAVGIMHLLLNWKAFAAYFRRRSATIAVLTCLFVSGALLCTKAQQKPDQIMQILDSNENGVIDANELADAARMIKRLDANGDSKIIPEELRLTRSPRR